MKTIGNSFSNRRRAVSGASSARSVAGSKAAAPTQPGPSNGVRGFEELHGVGGRQRVEIVEGEDDPLRRGEPGRAGAAHQPSELDEERARGVARRLGAAGEGRAGRALASVWRRRRAWPSPRVARGGFGLRVERGDALVEPRRARLEVAPAFAHVVAEQPNWPRKSSPAKAKARQRREQRQNAEKRSAPC